MVDAAFIVYLPDQAHGTVEVLGAKETGMSFQGQRGTDYYLVRAYARGLTKKRRSLRL